jgi:hypothetical protein
MAELNRPSIPGKKLRDELFARQPWLQVLGLGAACEKQPTG